MQREATFFEAVTQRLSAVARAQQAAQRSVLASLADAAALPLHLLATLAASTVKLAWTLLLAVTFLLPAALRPPLALCVCSVLAYAAFLRQVTAGAAAGLAAALVAFIFLPMVVRTALSRLLPTSTCACCISRDVCWTSTARFGLNPSVPADWHAWVPGRPWGRPRAGLLCHSQIRP